MWKKIKAWWNKLAELDEREWQRLREKSQQVRGFVVKEVKSTAIEDKDVK